MKEIREACAQNPELGPAFMDSVRAATDLLAARLRRTTWTERKLRVEEPGSDQLTDEMWKIALTIDPTLEKGKLTQKDLKKNSRWQSFLKSGHVQLGKTGVCIIKVLDCVCEFCTEGIIKPLRMSTEDFEDVHVIPFPEPKVDVPDKFKQFDEVYGKPTTEKFLPSSLKKNQSDVDNSSNGMFQQNYARDVIECVECFKQRVVYCKTALTAALRQKLVFLEENSWYSCGAPLMTPDDPDYKVMIVKQGLHCYDPMELQYYSKKLGVDVCGSCSLEDDLLDRKEADTNKFCTVAPQCRECVTNGAPCSMAARGVVSQMQVKKKRSKSLPTEQHRKKNERRERETVL
eukprot:Lithocolla_globosa_v1_NODE_689_length_3433_cov_2.908526.p1 type:complete len:345 gc:universal NODE_689_length_3433_cov_2.908526:1132-98(-)